mmetsp:Transcript_20403/g.50083  ORF Transcript_20403/g.50083 Transcript_20403/m.50083 type:complete len:103 (-) Transcript_20403:227-535(-)
MSSAGTGLSPPPESEGERGEWGERKMIGNTGVTFGQYRMYLKTVKQNYKVLEDACFKKCVAFGYPKKLQESELRCLDNCSFKLFQAQRLVEKLVSQAPPTES